VDNLELPKTSFWVDLTITNDDDVIDAFVNDEMLVNVDMTDATNMVGEEGNTFFVDTK
jgi:hypothetical protein